MPRKKQTPTKKKAPARKAPRSFTITISGYGGEYVLGTVKKSAFDYLKKRRISLETYIDDFFDQELKIPKKMELFSNRCWESCDNICHQTNAEVLSSGLTVESKGKKVLEKRLSDASVNKELIAKHSRASVPRGSLVFFGQALEKGIFFSATIEAERFELKKLTITYILIEGCPVVDAVLYDGERLDGEDGYFVTGKGRSFWIKASTGRPKKSAKGKR